MTEPTTKSIGFIGCGETARFHAEVLTSLNIKISCVFATSQKSKNIEGFANDFHIEKKYFDIDQMFLNEKLDAVWVVVPWNMNYKILKKVRKYNIPIFVEKPIACSLDEIYDLKDLYSDFNAHFQVGFNRRFYDFIPYLKEQLIKEKIKSILIEAPESSTDDKKFNNSMIHANTAHLIDLVYYLFGSMKLGYTTIQNKKNYSSILFVNENVPVHFISSWDISSNFSIKINSENKVFHMKPIEQLKIYNSMYVSNLSSSDNIRSYIPKEEDSFICDYSFKPGFLNQAKFFIESLDNKNMNQIASNLDSTFEIVKICEEIIGKK